MAFRTRGALPARWDGARRCRAAAAAAIAAGSPPALSPDLWSITLGSLLEGITYFMLVKNAFLIRGLHSQDKLVLCLCYTDTVFASLLLREQRCLTAARVGFIFSVLF